MSMGGRSVDNDAFVFIVVLTQGRDFEALKNMQATISIEPRPIWVDT